jgi:uncharacterized membrane protein YdjX (TVP38/TMEM64 family)
LIESIRNRRKCAGRWIILSLFILGIAAYFYFDLGRFLTLASLKENKDLLRNYTRSHYGAAVFVYIMIYTLQTALLLPGAAVLTLAGGFLFGAVLGTLYVNIAATSGATLAFFSARHLFREAVEEKFGEKLESIQQGVAENAFSVLLTFRLIPLFPFFLVNLAAGLAPIRLRTYVLATAVGILPGSFVYSNAGKQLGTIETIKDVLSFRVLGAFVLLGLLALSPTIYRWINRRPG